MGSTKMQLPLLLHSKTLAIPNYAQAMASIVDEEPSSTSVADSDLIVDANGADNIWNRDVAFRPLTAEEIEAVKTDVVAQKLLQEYEEKEGKDREPNRPQRSQHRCQQPLPSTLRASAPMPVQFQQVLADIGLLDPSERQEHRKLRHKLRVTKTIVNRKLKHDVNWRKSKQP